jgi:23S rRNA G2445 N2-methylase RlmL
VDKDLRNTLRTAVVQCRKALEADVGRQLEGTYGILPDGRVLPEDQLGKGWKTALRSERERILAAIRHIESYGLSRAQALEQFVRETAFTALNRLAALKLMEHPSRGLIQESVGKGKESRGVQLFQKISPEACRGEAEGGFRLYLEMLFDDLGRELRVLFDRELPNAIIFPSESCLKEVLDVLNDPCLSPAWAEDETIGWIYQYFTPKELRDESRKRGAPSNSYELAFRNQFYTPRYVVRFLVDNTLGRLWYEMRQGKTCLRDLCAYLIWTPGERFLGPSDEPASAPGADGTAAIVHRPMKDPRDIKILDPACGSGHFLLYAFDVLQAIYEEAYHDPEVPPFSETGRALRQEYSDEAALRRDTPVLILRHNLYGLDIDLRATQIAGLALWLRAQRTYQELDIRAGERPWVARSNIVCAEPMPGERELLDEFVGDLQPKVLGQLVQKVFEGTTLAGEAGSLLKIEAELREAIAAAKKQWLAGPKADQLLLFPEAKRARLEQLSLFDVSGITDEAFWEDAEGRVDQALQGYARRVENGKGYTRRLFADDAVQGFGFVDLCRMRFDVVLMNPPFGEASRPSRDYIQATYPVSRHDLAAAFMERGLEWLVPGGRLGAITTRTLFFLSSSARWRDQVILGRARLGAFADLGQGVLDTAMVETAAYCIEAVG